MTDYTKSTNFATKDNLASGNSLKIVKGTELDTEFNNIATAIATKADLNSPTFVGTPSLPTGTTAVTQSSGTNSTTLATTAFVQAVAALTLSAAYPVGSIYTNASNVANPATLLGFGTWTAFAAGRVLIGNGGGFSAGATGGSADAVVVSHTHTATVTDPAHNHGWNYLAMNGTTAGSGSYATGVGQTQTVSSQVTNITVSNSTEGVSGTNANLQPFIVVYMWQRTA